MNTNGLDYITFRDTDMCAVCRDLEEDEIRAELAQLGDVAFCFIHTPLKAGDRGRAALEEADGMPPKGCERCKEEE